jgi:hypothetical protein
LPEDGFSATLAETIWMLTPAQAASSPGHHNDLHSRVEQPGLSIRNPLDNRVEEAKIRYRVRRKNFVFDYEISSTSR